MEGVHVLYKSCTSFGAERNRNLRYGDFAPVDRVRGVYTQTACR